MEICFLTICNYIIYIINILYVSVSQNLQSRRWSFFKSLYIKPVCEIVISSIQYGGVETLCPRGHISVWWYWKILPSWTYFGLEVLKKFCPLGYWKILSPKFIKILNYIKSLCKIDLNILKHFDQKKSDKKIYTQFSVPKCFNTPHIIYYRRTFLQPLSENPFYFFFIMFWHSKCPSSFRMQRYWH